MPDTTCDIHDVYKTFGHGASATHVLRGITLRAAGGECVFLVGPSGSGKTTLLSILGCMLRPDAGMVSVLGNDVAGMSESDRAELRRNQIGFMFQRFHLVRGLSAMENTIVPLLIRGVAPRQAERRGMELLAAVGLADKARQQPTRLSIGQRQRIALARALVNDPQLVLADEPTAALDAETGQSAMQLLRQLTADAGRTAIVVTHDPRILPFADRVLRLENGRIQASDHPPPLAASAPELVAAASSRRAREQDAPAVPAATLP